MNVDRANNSNENSSPFGDFQYNFRGVGDAGNYPTRNYFLYYGNSDAYNAERFEFSRGPNSVLFGDGQIGGLATTMTKQARFGPTDIHMMGATPFFMAARTGDARSVRSLRRHTAVGR